MKLLNNLFIGMSFLMVLGAFALHYLAWKKILAPDEPQVVLHLSIAAMWFSAFGNIIGSVVNKKVDK